MRLATLALLALAAGCVTQPGQMSNPASQTSSAKPKTTLLLVALDDGTYVKQEISVDADVCMKKNGDSVTTCYTEGSPIHDPRTSAIIGYRMEKTSIRLFNGR